VASRAGRDRNEKAESALKKELSEKFAECDARVLQMEMRLRMQMDVKIDNFMCAWILSRMRPRMQMDVVTGTPSVRGDRRHHDSELGAST